MGVYRQFSNVQNLGDKGYFPLRVSKLTKQGDGTSTTTRVYERFIFLTSYDESFDANWSVESTPYGRLNPKYTYTQTTRKINLSFTLPARNVAEAKSNLDFCSGLANLVYGDYVERGGDFVYQGANLTNKIKFGNLLRDELCYFTEFSFSPVMDAGVFEYSATSVQVGDSETAFPKGVVQEKLFELTKASELIFVNHSQKGKVYPKLVTITLSAVVLATTPLGFGGPLRGLQYPLRWAQNEGKDWPHGTGPIGVMKYMKKTSNVAATTPSAIDQFYEDNPTYNIGPDGELVPQ
jgi:hypothetical protein